MAMPKSTQQGELGWQLLIMEHPYIFFHQNEMMVIEKICRNAPLLIVAILTSLVYALFGTAMLYNILQLFFYTCIYMGRQSNILQTTKLFHLPIYYIGGIRGTLNPTYMYREHGGKQRMVALLSSYTYRWDLYTKVPSW